LRLDVEMTNMLAKMMIAAAVAATAFLASPAWAQSPQVDQRWYSGNWSSGERGEGALGSTYNGSGAYWYCPPGQAPQSFPNGQGYRCQSTGGGW
jgi:hypothetical protein